MQRNQVIKVVTIVTTLIVLCLGFLSIKSLALYTAYSPDKTAIKGSETLIMTVKTSGGHMSTAQAIKNKLAEYGHKSDLFIFDLYDPTDSGSIYESFMTTRTGRFLCCKFMPSFVWRYGSLYALLFGTSILESWLSNGNYKCIVITMCLLYKMTNQALTNCGLKIPFIIVPTDYEDSGIEHGLWIDGPNALYLLGTDRLLEQCPKEYNKRRINGLVVRPEFTEDIKSKEERRAELGLPKDKPIIMIMFGKCGSEDMVHAALSMKDLKQYHFVFVCGTNAKIKESIDGIKRSSSCEHYTICGFANHTHKIMQASDIFVGKPGGSTTSEVICSQLPMLYSKDMILEQEIYNGKYMEELGIGIGFVEIRELVTLIPKVMNEMDKFKEAYKKVPKNNALNQVCEMIIETIRKHN